MEDNRKAFKSPFKLKKEAKDLEIYNKFSELMAIPGAQKVQVTAEIMELFPDNVNSPATVWAIRRRVEKIKQEEKSN